MGKTISPAQAEKQSGISRRTITRAIKKADIKAFRDNRNHWQIDLKSFEAWASAQGAHSGRAQQIAHPDAQSQSIQIAELKTEVRFLTDQLSETKADRDAWRDMAGELSKEKTGFWATILSRKNR